MALTKAETPAEKCLPSFSTIPADDNALYFSHWQKTTIAGAGFEYSIITASDDEASPRVSSIFRGGMLVAEIHWEFRKTKIRMGGEQGGQPWIPSKQFLQSKGVFNMSVPRLAFSPAPSNSSPLPSRRYFFQGGDGRQYKWTFNLRGRRIVRTIISLVGATSDQCCSTSSWPSMCRANQTLRRWHNMIQKLAILKRVN